MSDLMDEIEWWEFASAREMAEQAAGDIAFVVESAIEAHGGARLALAADGVPQAVLEALAEAQFDWSKVAIMPTHDRLVALDDPDGAHERLRGRFGALGATIVSLVDESALDDAEEAGRLADQRLALLEWPLDLALLGVDEDGHVAFIVPGADFERAVAGPRERRAVGVNGAGVTLTAAALSSARAVMIVASGGRRRAALEQAIKDGPLSDRSAGRVIAEIDTGIDILWAPEG